MVQGGRYLAFVGRLHEDKRLQIVVATMFHMSEDYMLHVAGQEDSRIFVPEGHALNERMNHGVV
jgi:hypothetical protein